MIICPKCKIGLKVRGNNYQCDRCHYLATKKDNIILFNPEIRQNLKSYNAKLLYKLYQYEQKHFWFIARKQIILDTFEKFVSKDKSIIEIGAGTGDIMRSLTQKGYRHIAVGEIHLAGLKYALKYGLKKLYQFDVTQSPFRNHFDVVGAFDVLEHIDNDNLAIQNIRQMLKKNGRLIATVPAMPWLWSDIDRQSGHARRYNQITIRQLFEQNSWEIISIKGFFILILPFLIIRSWLNQQKSKKKLEDRAGFRINTCVNLILKAIMACERLLLKNASGNWAGSLIIVAKKKEQK